MESDLLQAPTELLANPAQALQWLEAQAPRMQKRCEIMAFSIKRR